MGGSSRVHCCSNTFNNSIVVSALVEEHLEAGTDRQFVSSFFVKPLHKPSECFTAHIGVCGLGSHAVVGAVKLVLVVGTPHLFQVSVDREPLSVRDLQVS